MSNREMDNNVPKLGSIFRGEVVSIKDYGAFVKIPWCRKNGLVHRSQLSQCKVDDVSEVVSVKDSVWCKVISLGENNDKISLSMKVVNQGSGKDLDPNGVQMDLDAKRQKTFTSSARPKITLGAVFNTVCKKCGTKGHLAQDCFQLPGGKSYDLLPDDDLENSFGAADVSASDRGPSKSTDVRANEEPRADDRRQTRKRRRSSSTSSSSSSDESVESRGSGHHPKKSSKRRKKKKRKKKKKHSKKD